MLKLYKTYNKAKDVFVKPKLVWKFGKWRHDPCLPVWRRGPIWWIGGSSYKANSKCYQIYNQVPVKTHSKGDLKPDGTVYQFNYYESSVHKLPGNLKPWDTVWKSKYRKLFRKFGLKIARAYIQFPIWMSFYIFNRDVMWKTKWTNYDFRYEFPPQFTIVFFGLSLSFWLYPECKSETDSPDHYWESLLTYIYGEHAGDLLQTIIDCGKWIRSENNKDTEFFALSKNYIKPECYEIYDEAIELYDELIKNNKNND